MSCLESRDERIHIDRFDGEQVPEQQRSHANSNEKQERSVEEEERGEADAGAIELSSRLGLPRVSDSLLSRQLIKDVEARLTFPIPCT